MAGFIQVANNDLHTAKKEPPQQQSRSEVPWTHHPPSSPQIPRAGSAHRCPRIPGGTGVVQRGVPPAPPAPEPRRPPLRRLSERRRPGSAPRLPMPQRTMGSGARWLDGWGGGRTGMRAASLNQTTDKPPGSLPTRSGWGGTTTIACSCLNVWAGGGPSDWGWRWPREHPFVPKLAALFRQGCMISSKTIIRNSAFCQINGRNDETFIQATNEGLPRQTN